MCSLPNLDGYFKLLDEKECVKGLLNVKYEGFTFIFFLLPLKLLDPIYVL